MCAEIWDDEKEGWENPSGKDNHFWDCEVMALALAFIMNVRHMRRPENAPDRPRPPERRERRERGDTSTLDRFRR